MNDVTYEAAWGVVEPIMEMYFTDLDAMKAKTGDDAPSRLQIGKLHEDYIVVRDEFLEPLGVKFEDLVAENARRVSLLEKMN